MQAGNGNRSYREELNDNESIGSGVVMCRGGETGINGGVRLEE